jgi:phosphonate transport system substrate-binding protein
LGIDLVRQDFEARLLTGEPDFSWVNPYHALMAHNKHGYLTLVRDGKSLLSGLLTVRGDSPVNSLNQLSDANIAFPSPNAFAASLLIRAELAKKKIDINPVFVKTHSNVYRSIIGKDAVAGGGVNNTLDNEVPEVRQQLRVLFETPAYTPHPIVTHPSVTAAVRDRFLKAMLKLTQDDEGRKLLDSCDALTHRVQVAAAGATGTLLAGVSAAFGSDLTPRRGELTRQSVSM